MFSIVAKSFTLRGVIQAVYHLRPHPSDGPDAAGFNVNAALTERGRGLVSDAIVAICADPKANEADARLAKLLVTIIGHTCTYPVEGQPTAYGCRYSEADRACTDLFRRLKLPLGNEHDPCQEVNEAPLFEALLLATEAAKPIQKDVDLLTKTADMLGVPKRHAIRDCIAKLASEVPQPAPDEPTAYLIEKAVDILRWTNQITLDARANTKQQAWDRFVSIKRANPNETFRFTAVYPQ